MTAILLLKKIFSSKIYALVAAGIVVVLCLGGWQLLSNNSSQKSNLPKTNHPVVSSDNTTTPQSTTNTTTKPKTTTKKPAKSSTTSKSSTSTSATNSTSTSVSKTKSSSSSKQSSGSTQSSNYSCIKQPSDDGQCDYSAVSYISGASSNPWVGQNIWNGGGGYQQTLYANSPKDWYVTANANTDWGGVLTFPNTGFDMGGTVDSYSSITSSWNVTLPTDNTKVAGWAAYDLWFNNWNDEVMIQTDLTVPSNGYYDCTGVATATFSGITWHMCQFGSERVWKPGTDDDHLINRSSGSVDVLAIIKYMEDTSGLNDKLPAGSTWTAGSFGFEICDTHGTNQIFRVNGFSWSAT